jgi:predicted ATPase/DNA-binding SARP family transcriptional activator/Tfp pilus assembly protein PilF
MPPRLILQFLGLPQVHLDDKPIATDRRKAIALLAYLAVNDIGRPRQKYSRESLSALFWPDYQQAKAFSNLRRTIWEIHQAIGEGWLIADRESVHLNPDAEIDLDVARFQELLSQSQQQNDPALRIPLLSEAVKLSRDHFLTGFSLKDAPNFNEWIFAESEELRRNLADALTLLSEDHCALGQADKAIPYGRRLVTLDQLNESSHRKLMEVYLQAGQHSAALKQYQTCEQILRKELNIDPQPETRALYKRILKGEVKPVRTEKQIETPTPKSNLPVQVSSFIGREKEQDEIINLITKDRLVTLTGVGGIGKTRLALKAAHQVLNTFTDGVWFIDLAPLSDPALVPYTTINTMGLIEQANRPPQTILIDFLQAKKSLLIFDNCEHLIQGCAQLAETLLQACPDLHILATSREALDIPGETVYLVPTLTTPDPSNSTLGTLSQYEAVQLFVERAQSAVRDFSVTQDNASAIAQVCHHLDGIPLALELAAARVKLLRVEEIATRLDDRFRLFTGGARTALPRHQTLRAMIDWSHDLLSGPERALLRRLSVFAGGWSLEAAESVCGGEDIETPEILDLLTQLLNKSLVLAERKHGQETRYRMLETIRQYANKNLWEAGEGERLRQRHLAYFVEFAERAEPNLRAIDMAIWLDRLEAELDNIRSALEYALESDVEAELRLASALLWFWHIRGHTNEGIDWLEQGLSIETAARSDQPLSPNRAMLRGKALNVIGFLVHMMGMYEKAVAFSEESLSIFRELGPAGKRDGAYALCLLGIHRFRQDVRQAKLLLEEALALSREVGDKFGIAQCLNHLAAVAWNQGHKENARALLEEALALRKKIGDKDGIAFVLEELGNQAVRKGDYKQATICYEESLALFREVGNKGGVGVVLTYLGRVARAQDNYERAATFLEGALTLGQDLGDKNATAERLVDLGSVAQSEGSYRRATQIYEEALTLFREIENQFGIAVTLRHLGLAALQQGNYEQASKRFDEALAISQEIDNTFGSALTLYYLGKVAQAQGDDTLARVFHTKAIINHLEIGNRPGIALCLEAFAIMSIGQNKMESALPSLDGLRRAVRLFGAAEILYAPPRFELSAKERAEHDQAVAATRAALGEEAFTAAWEEGKTMTLEQAVEFALQED